jgi:hypothetical protein
MKMKRKTKPTPITPEIVQTAITVSTRQLLESGAAVLGEQFGFSDEMQAEWIRLTAELAKARVMGLAAVVKRANERVKENGK